MSRRIPRREPEWIPPVHGKTVHLGAATTRFSLPPSFREARNKASSLRRNSRCFSAQGFGDVFLECVSGLLGKSSRAWTNQKWMDINGYEMMSKKACFFLRRSLLSVTLLQKFCKHVMIRICQKLRTLANQLEKVAVSFRQNQQLWILRTRTSKDWYFDVYESQDWTFNHPQMVKKSNENGNKSMYILLMGKIPTGKLLNSWYIYNINWWVVSIKYMHNLVSSYSSLSSQMMSPYTCRYILYIYSPLYTTRFSHSVTYYIHIIVYTQTSIRCIFLPVKPSIRGCQRKKKRLDWESQPVAPSACQTWKKWPLKRIHIPPVEENHWDPATC